MDEAWANNFTSAGSDLAEDIVKSLSRSLSSNVKTALQFGWVVIIIYLIGTVVRSMVRNVIVVRGK
jgi:hypothetical protein